MKGLILAAGFGKRLQPLTNEIPKCMVQAKGVPLLARSLDALAELGIDEIALVVGHMADYVRREIGTRWQGATISYFENSRYLETNNIASFNRAAPFMDDDLLMLECDLYYRSSILRDLASSEGDCAILVSPFNPATMDGSVVRARDGAVTELILGKWQDADFDPTRALKTVTMYKFTKRFLRKFVPLVEWDVNNMGEKSYYEKALGALIYLRECDVRAVVAREEDWIEIDSASDLARAESAAF